MYRLHSEGVFYHTCERILDMRGALAGVRMGLVEAAVVSFCQYILILILKILKFTCEISLVYI